VRRCLKENVQRVAIVATSRQDGGLHWKGEENKENGKAGDKRLRDSRPEKEGKEWERGSHTELQGEFSRVAS